MKNLQVNDHVYTGNNKVTGGAVYQPVYSFGHLDRSAASVDYIQIFHDKTSKTKPPIELSSDHLIFLASSSSPVRAETIKVGDTIKLKTADQATEQVAVTKIDTVTRTGAYLPMTPDGTIVVNDIAASVYGSVQQHYPSKFVGKILGIVPEQTLYHWYNAPYRMVCLGISPKLCENDYDENGIIYFHSILLELASAAKHYSAVIQVMIVIVGCVMFIPFVVAESILGPCFGWFGLLPALFAVANSLHKKVRRAKKNKGDVYCGASATKCVKSE